MTPVDPSAVRAAQALPSITLPGGGIRLEARLQVSGLSVGQEVTAQVLTDRAVGRFLASIDGTPVEIALPRGARAGDSVRLVVVAEGQRLLLVPRQDAGAGAAPGGLPTASASAAPAQAVAAAPAAVAEPGPAPGPGEVSVSAEGRALNRLVSDITNLAAGQRAAGTTNVAGGSAPAATAAPAQGAAAVLIAEPADHPAMLAPQIAGALQKTLSASGLFYESHQAQWVAGERSLESLKAEPQGRLLPLAARIDAGQGRAPDFPAGPAPAGAGQSAAAAQASPARDSAPGVGTAALAALVDPSSAQVVQQQLTMLDSRMAVWSGQVLPGMHAQMTVEERPAQEDPSGAAAESTDWSTRLAVSLPRLGTVDAQLTLRGNRLVLSIAAGEAGTATELGTARGQLAQALSDAGLQVDTLQVALR